jgi:hypothetical protein
MKTKFLIFFITVFSLSACKKDYTCTCDLTMAGQSVSQSYEIKNKRKNEVQAACNNAGAYWINLGGTCNYE